jgi:AcrR family transcriptional regulator
MKDQNVKERIITTASRLFYAQGYQATGINQVIEEAQVAKSSLYQHFASKEILLNEYLSSYRQEWRTNFRAFEASLKPGKEKLEGLFAYRKEVSEKGRFKGCTFCRISYELPELDAVSAETIRDHKTFLKRYIDEQLRAIKDPYPEDELKDMTELLFNLSEGAVLQATIFGNGQPLEDCARIVRNLLKPL